MLLTATFDFHFFVIFFAFSSSSINLSAQPDNPLRLLITLGLYHRWWRLPGSQQVVILQKGIPYIHPSEPKKPKCIILIPAHPTQARQGARKTRHRWGMLGKGQVVCKCTAQEDSWDSNVNSVWCNANVNVNVQRGKNSAIKTRTSKDMSTLRHLSWIDNVEAI